MSCFEFHLKNAGSDIYHYLIFRIDSSGYVTLSTQRQKCKVEVPICLRKELLYSFRLICSLKNSETVASIFKNPSEIVYPARWGTMSTIMTHKKRQKAGCGEDQLFCARLLDQSLRVFLKRTLISRSLSWIDSQHLPFEGCCFIDCSKQIFVFIRGGAKPTLMLLYRSCRRQ